MMWQVKPLADRFIIERDGETFARMWPDHFSAWCFANSLNLICKR